MSEEKAGLVKSGETRLPKFVEDAYETVEKMEQFAEILLKSKLVPNHFYEQLPDKKPDFSKGKIPAVVAVLIQAYQLDIPPMTALQHIVPVNGLLSIKGDLAKSMIFNSGKLKTGSWKEEDFGSIEEGNLVVKITATRSDNGQTLTRSFSVEKAKRAGLWITESQVNGQDGWKHKSSAWWKYPERMINYRALGFISRDLFPDVMAGIYTTEEAMDIPADQTVVLEQNGVKITIPDKGFAADRSEKITQRAVGKIENKSFTPIPEHKQATTTLAGLAVTNKDESPFIPGRGSVEYMDGNEISRDAVDPLADDKPSDNLTLEGMMDMETDDLAKLIHEDADMVEAMMMIPGKNTNKKLREIIFAHQQGKLSEHCAPYVEASEKGFSDEAGNEEIPINKDFDKQTPEATPTVQNDELIKPETSELNKYGLPIPAFNKGNERDFATVKELYSSMLNIKPRLDNERFLELQKGIPEFANYEGKEHFCKYATIEEVCRLLNENYISS